MKKEKLMERSVFGATLTPEVDAAAWSPTMSTANATSYLPPEAYVLEDGNVVCYKCGHNKLFLSDRPGFAYTSYPGANVTYYICEKCEHEFGVTRPNKIPAREKAKIVRF